MAGGRVAVAAVAAALWMLTGCTATATEGGPSASSVETSPEPERPAVVESEESAPPDLDLTCSEDFEGRAEWVDVSFGYDYDVNEPFTIEIDYGDGRTYEDDHQNLDLIFSHRYKAPGSYSVSAVLTTQDGVSSPPTTCAWTWLRPVSTIPGLCYDIPDDLIFEGAREEDCEATGEEPIWRLEEVVDYQDNCSVGSPIRMDRTEIADRFACISIVSWGDAPPTRQWGGSTGGCPSGTYTNSDGHSVCSPHHSDTKPSGASARCRDGTYSYSRSRRGTCSHHGGVAQWY